MSVHQSINQAKLSSLEEPIKHQSMEKIALFTEDGQNVADVIADLLERVEELEP